MSGSCSRGLSDPLVTTAGYRLLEDMDDNTEGAEVSTDTLDTRYSIRYVENSRTYTDGVVTCHVTFKVTWIPGTCGHG